MKMLMNVNQTRARRMPTALLGVFCLLVCFAAGAFAQDAKIDLSRLDKLASKASKVTNVSLDGPMLRMAAENSAAKNLAPKQKAESDVLQRLKGIYVRAYKFDKPGEYSRADVESVLKQLKSHGWTSVVNVEKKQEGEITAIYEMNEGGEAVGMTVVAAKPTKLTVVNLVGPIDFSQLGALDALDGMLSPPAASLRSNHGSQKGTASSAR